MKTCPSGHQTESADFCDVCGMEVDAPTAHLAVPVGGISSPGKEAAVQSAAKVSTRSSSDKVCPICTTPRLGIFCELCGYNFSTCQAPVESETLFAPETAAAVDTETGSALAPASVEEANPDLTPGWYIVLEPQNSGGILSTKMIAFVAPEMIIGRTSKRSSSKPDIDLAGDDSVSHRHAVLKAIASQGFAIMDLDSANGTRLNRKALLAQIAIPIQPGDRITIGVQWYLSIKEIPS